MSDFGRIHSKFWKHKKVEAAGLGAIGLWAVCNSWSRDHRTAGFIPYETVNDLFIAGDLAGDLVRARLWIPVAGGYQFYAWQEWNTDDHPKGAAGALIDKVIPRDHPQVTRGALEKQVLYLMDEGTDMYSLEAALKRWLSRPGAGATLLPFLVSDVLRERAEDDLGAMLREAHETGDISKLARKGMIFTPPDDDPPGLDVAGLRAWNLKAKRVWIKTKIEELKS